MTHNLLLQATLWVVVLSVVYAVLARGLFRAAEPLRQIALDLACELEESGELSDLDKRVITYSLNELHSVAAAWKVARIAAVVLFTWPFRTRGKEPAPDRSRLTPEVAKKFARLQFYWLICAVANSPAAAAIFMVCSLLATAYSASGGLVASIYNSRHHGDDHHHNNHARA